MSGVPVGNRRRTKLKTNTKKWNNFKTHVTEIGKTLKMRDEAITNMKQLELSSKQNILYFVLRCYKISISELLAICAINTMIQCSKTKPDKLN
jgi:hypothetical protein